MAFVYITKPYITKAGRTVKIGYTSKDNVNARIAKMQTYFPEKIEVMHLIEANSTSAKAIERTIKAALKLDCLDTDANVEELYSASSLKKISGIIRDIIKVNPNLSLVANKNNSTSSNKKRAHVPVDPNGKCEDLLKAKSAELGITPSTLKSRFCAWRSYHSGNADFEMWLKDYVPGKKVA